MVKLTLDLAALHVESFPVNEDAVLSTPFPRTHEPGCTMCPVCPAITC